MSEPVSTTPATHEFPGQGTSPLFEALIGSLDAIQQRAVLEAIARHEAEVRAAEAAGERAVEAR